MAVSLYVDDKGTAKELQTNVRATGIISGEIVDRTSASVSVEPTGVDRMQHSIQPTTLCQSFCECQSDILTPRVLSVHHKLLEAAQQLWAMPSSHGPMTTRPRTWLESTFCSMRQRRMLVRHRMRMLEMLLHVSAQNFLPRCAGWYCLLASENLLLYAFICHRVDPRSLEGQAHCGRQPRGRKGRGRCEHSRRASRWIPVFAAI